MNNGAEIEVRVFEELDRQGYSKQPSSDGRLWEAEALWPALNLVRRILMACESRITIAPFRRYYEGEIEAMIRQMKVEGGTLEDCIAELNILANFVRSQAEGVKRCLADSAEAHGMRTMGAKTE